MYWSELRVLAAHSGIDLPDRPPQPSYRTTAAMQHAPQYGTDLDWERIAEQSLTEGHES